MKKKGLNLLVALLFTAVALTGCGEKETSASQKDTEKEVIKEDVVESKENVENDSTENDTEDPVLETIIESITEIEPVISTMKESEAYIDFDGIKLPMDITYKEFLEFMANNNWKWIAAYTYGEGDLPNEEKGKFYGACYLMTNCGMVFVRFMPSEDESYSVLRYVNFEQTNISIAGITRETSIEAIEKVLSLESKWDMGISFYLDDYLTISFVDDNFLEDGYDAITVSREQFHMRKAD